MGLSAFVIGVLVALRELWLMESVKSRGSDSCSKELLLCRASALRASPDDHSHASGMHGRHHA